MTTRAREIGRLRGAAPGPTLILVGAIHGNEPAGAVACENLFEHLRRTTLRAGEIVAFVGNPEARAAHRRHVARDLNRQWTPERIAAARARGTSADVEERALVSLADALDEVMARARGPVVALDLHTSSSEGVPFIFVGEGEGDQELASHFPLPGIAGVHPMLPGVLVNHLAARGCVALAIEGGQSDSAAAAANLDAVLTLALVACGLFDAEEVAGYAEARETLSRARGDLPPLIRAISRHQVDPTGGFRMAPGYRNISRVSAGALLAHEHGAPVAAPSDGFVLLPLYQEQGEDGFFFGRAGDPRA